ncbi:MAG: MerR family transcriptional regulator [Chitinophagaceae bacterium]|nr:MerR family transcriptional regulator [Chitinophagaceae bacterium]
MSFAQLDLFGLPVEPKPAKKPIAKPEKVYAEPIEALKSKRGRKPKPASVNDVKKVKSKRGRKPFNEVYADVDLINVPDEAQLNQKLYYSISEVAGWFNITISQLRFWTNEFTILQPRKNRKGDRLYRPEDIKNLKTIYYLLRVRKLSIEGSKDYLKANQHKIETQFQLQESLQKLKAFLLELKANL